VRRKEQYKNTLYYRITS